MSLFSAGLFGPDIPDSVIDNFEDAPDGPYNSGDTILTYYTEFVSSFARSTNSILGSQSVSRDGSAGFNSGIISSPGDGLPNYPAEGETVSIITDDLSQRPGVIAAAPGDGRSADICGLRSHQTIGVSGGMTRGVTRS